MLVDFMKVKDLQKWSWNKVLRERDSREFNCWWALNVYHFMVYSQFLNKQERLSRNEKYYMLEKCLVNSHIMTWACNTYAPVFVHLVYSVASLLYRVFRNSMEIWNIFCGIKTNNIKPMVYVFFITNFIIEERQKRFE